MATIKVKDLAAKLNLSSATISLVLNNKPGISKATREKVRAAVCELGYEELLVQNDVVKKSIMFMVYRKNGTQVQNSSYFSQIFSETIEGVSSQIKALGYNLMITYVDKDNVAEEALKIHTEDIHGVLLLATEMQEEQMQLFSGLSVPVVILDNYVENSDFDCVTINNEQGVHEVVRYLVSMGHTQIGYLHVLASANNFNERHSGFFKAMQKYNLKVCEENVISLCTDGGEAVYQELTKKMAQLVNLNKPMPTAFFADNDIIAICAIRVLKELGIEIPKDVSIIGFDNIILSEMLTPPLTSIQIPKHKMGVVAANTIVEKIKEPSDGVLKIEVRTTLAIRESVKKFTL